MPRHRDRASNRLLSVADALLAPFVYPCAWLLKSIRRAGVHRLPLCRAALMKVGVFPVRDHYYEPQFDHRRPGRPFSQERALPGIDWRIDEQLARLGSFSFAHEIADLPLNYLHHNHYERLKAVAPGLTPDREPGSFYLQEVS